jgi:hypothetical protein
VEHHGTRARSSSGKEAGQEASGQKETGTQETRPRGEQAPMPDEETSEKTQAPLAHNDLLALLVERGHLNGRDAVEGDITFDEVVGHNLHYRVRGPNGRGLFVKQPRWLTPEARDSIALETAIYRLFEGPQFAALRPCLPRRVFDDERRSLLALELLPYASIDEAFLEPRSSEWLSAVGNKLGHALGTCHAALSAPPKIGVELSREPPWALGIHRPTPHWLFDISNAQLELLRLIQQQEPLCQALEELGDAWQPTALIHGDMRHSNILVWGDDTDISMRVVDWEFASWGDPLWDVGALWQSLLADSLLSTDWAAASDVDAASRHVAAWMNDHKPYTRGFWPAYVKTRPELGSAEAARQAARQAARYCAARMLQWGYELSANAETLSREVAGAVQFSINIMARPAEAASQLMGMEET